jgi:hypothetical protein
MILRHIAGTAIRLNSLCPTSIFHCHLANISVMPTRDATAREISSVLGRHDAAPNFKCWRLFVITLLKQQAV